MDRGDLVTILLGKAQVSVPLATRIQTFVHAFQDQARRFDQLVTNVAQTGRTSETELFELSLWDECGRLLIAAADQDLLPRIEGLQTCIEFYSTQQDDPGVAKKVRSPANLFVDVVGGNLLPVRNDGGQLVAIGPPGGGLLSSSGIAFAELRAPYRYAPACRLIAELIVEQLPSHAVDFHSVMWFGTRYTFAKGHQAESVRHLWGAWEAGGHSMSQEAIADEIGLNGGFNLSKVFRVRRTSRAGYDHHPAWGTMIQAESKGVYRLVPPDKKSR